MLDNKEGPIMMELENYELGRIR